MLVELGLVEQRYQAVREVLDGEPVTVVARRYGVAAIIVPSGSGKSTLLLVQRLKVVQGSRVQSTQRGSSTLTPGQPRRGVKA